MTAPHPIPSSDEGKIPHLPPTPESESLKEMLAEGRRAYELWEESAIGEVAAHRPRPSYYGYPVHARRP